MKPSKGPRLRVVVDGSNLATEGRVTPSLSQLDEAVSAFQDENPGAEIIVVADASFEHRAAVSERSRFNDAVLAREIVTPPAGAVGRGDAFILKIANRIDAVVLSNDSFQEFHDEYPWLFDVGRLIGGKPVKGVGWIFTSRLPVRNTKAVRAVKKVTPSVPDAAKSATPATPSSAKGVKKVAPPKRPLAKASGADPAPEKTVAKTTKRVVKETPKPAKIVKTSTPAKVAKKAAKVADKILKAPPLAAPVVALRRGRQPVNDESDFEAFVAKYKIGARVPGEVKAFTSHGAVIRVVLKAPRSVECYAPTTSLGVPPPSRARDVLARGDQRVFRLTAVDPQRRIAELALT